MRRRLNSLPCHFDGTSVCPFVSATRGELLPHVINRLSDLRLHLSWTHDPNNNDSTEVFGRHLRAQRAMSSGSITAPLLPVTIFNVEEGRVAEFRVGEGHRNWPPQGPVKDGAEAAQISSFAQIIGADG